MKKGFTLIEILIVTSLIMVIIGSISGIMSGVFSSQSKNKATDKINQNGSWILNELKKTILNAKSNGVNGGENFSCPMGVSGNSITITNVKDGEKITISCLGNVSAGYKIASISAVGTTTYLFQGNNDLFLKNCDEFVTCSTLPSLQLSKVKFNFGLGAGVFGLSSGTTKSFSIDLTLRN
ncbi:MAG: type II secretion system protein [Candidatus Shapirobacteria bacterium]|nr:type II secretion system protein [Candidatus Shapirobacteria bacterium]MDD3002323.1 type II secretion system protein [Candidatus Shapirobacteria bacterium]MDD4382672.1 type II secretion system protein [Candidatus Shapirobacteria bacterium]